MADKKNMTIVSGGEKKKLQEKYGNLEDLKKGYIGSSYNGSRFNLYKDKTNGDIYVALNDNKETQYYVCNIRNI